MKLYTAEQLKKKFAGKYIDTYPDPYGKKDKNGNWVTLYEVRKVSSTIRENCNLPEDCIID
jgi:hypothetical protein